MARARPAPPSNLGGPPPQCVLLLQALISLDKEPITPLVAKIQALTSQGVSCILVIGGSGTPPPLPTLHPHGILQHMSRTQDYCPA